MGLWLNHSASFAGTCVEKHLGCPKECHYQCHVQEVAMCQCGSDSGADFFVSRLRWFRSTWNQSASKSHCPDKAAHLQTRLTIIQGPPGTGKTHTSATLLHRMFSRKLWTTANGLEASRGLLKTIEVFESVVSSWSHFARLRAGPGSDKLDRLKVCGFCFSFFVPQVVGFHMIPWCLPFLYHVQGPNFEQLGALAQLSTFESQDGNAWEIEDDLLYHLHSFGIGIFPNIGLKDCR